MSTVRVVGGGLAGCEAAWQLADRGVAVEVIEMRPAHTTQAHGTDRLAEIVCSNSFKSTRPDTASGILKAELEILGCRLLEVARNSSVPAGHALAVDRDIFSSGVTTALESHPGITVVRRRQDDLNLPMPVIIASGPLTSEGLSHALRDHCSSEHLYFYDAIAPSVEADRVDETVAFRASRYNKGSADYLNIPFDETQYRALVEKIRAAQLVAPHAFEEQRYFEACLPIEVMAARGEDTLRFGPLRPRGLVDPRTGREPYAVLQLRQESAAGNLLGLVGFQTRMTYEAQKELIHSIPGLSGVRILRFGSIHRNIFLNVPRLCDPYQRDRDLEGLVYAGQICGVEGYVECIASGLVAALSVFADERGCRCPSLPDESMIGSLMRYVHTSAENFQPMNANVGILPARTRERGGRKARYLEAFRRATEAIRAFREQNCWLFDAGSDRPFPL